MNCIIVDDDMFSTRMVADFIGRTSSLDLVSKFGNAIDALDFLAVSNIKIDVIFLDIEMPEMSGLDFMRSVNLHGAQVIIYSSQEKYALESYEYDVCDYLLKPVTYARFLKAINKVKSALADTQDVDVDASETSESTDDAKIEEVYVKDNVNDIYKIRFSDVIYIEAMENYVLIVTTVRRIMVHTSMVKILQKFPESHIVRTHRSYAVGKRYIKDIVGGDIEMLLVDEKIPIGKSYRDQVREILDSAMNM